MKREKYNIVFDLDSVIVEPVDLLIEEKLQTVEDRFGKEFLDDHVHTACGYPHLVYPGFYALWQWLHGQKISIYVFSTGKTERNVEIVEKLAARAFRGFEQIPEIKVYSRDDCIDTRTMSREEGAKYQSYFYGNRKKKLSGMVVKPEELPNTLLIEDDRTYMTKGEEYNLVKVPFSVEYFPHSDYRRDTFQYFHKAFYLCGLLEKIMQEAEKQNVSLAHAAKFVQVDLEGKQLCEEFYYPSIDKMEYFEEGLKILQTFDEKLKFHFLPKH